MLIWPKQPSCIRSELEDPLFLKHLVIHGGIHRTGTTSLQNAFAHNRNALSQAGISYPGKQRNHQSWAWDRLSGKTDDLNIVTAIDKNIHGTVILSAEDFCRFRDLKWLKIVRQKHSVSAHFFVRRQDDWLTSWYNQNIRWPFDKRTATMTAAEFLATLNDYYWLDFEWLGDLWADAIGAENVHMHLFGGDTLAQFRQISAPGIEFEENPLPNDSAPPDAVEFLRQMDLLSMTPYQRQRIVRAVRQVFRGRGTSKNIYSIAEREKIIDRFRRSNAAAFSKYVRGDVRDFDYSIEDRTHYVPEPIDSKTMLTTIIQPMMKLLAEKPDTAI